MTDEELIARLRDAPADGLGTENLCIAAADRIEALVKEKDDAGIKRAAWELEAKTLQARVERLEAALREIESISVHSGGEIHGVTADHWKMAFEQAQDVASAALK